MFFLNLKTVQTVLLQHLIDCVHPVYSYRQKVQKGMETNAFVLNSIYIDVVSKTKLFHSTCLLRVTRHFDISRVVSGEEQILLARHCCIV